MLDDIGVRLRVVHGEAGSPFDVADERRAELRVIGQRRSSAARLIVAAKRNLCSGVIRRSRWWASIRE